MQMLDADHDDKLTREECVQGFSKWFDSWDPGKTGSITNDQLRDGINQTFVPPGGGPGGPPGGPPSGAPGGPPRSPEGPGPTP